MSTPTKLASVPTGQGEEAPAPPPPSPEGTEGQLGTEGQVGVSAEYVARRLSHLSVSSAGDASQIAADFASDEEAAYETADDDFEAASLDERPAPQVLALSAKKSVPLLYRVL